MATRFVADHRCDLFNLHLIYTNYIHFMFSILHQSRQINFASCYLILANAIFGTLMMPAPHGKLQQEASDHKCGKDLDLDSTAANGYMQTMSIAHVTRLAWRIEECVLIRIFHLAIVLSGQGDR
ncbi:hypothetical protein M011DRAFT_4382 [Sporormia fimetaria CBS 119925]|uniref:Uncharacterized protein n=1 Tax=Sporormia fimetaria CBS 119925 TaxID=1340428 RepID=A0A6A6VR48_9PLEO|nr:hypothetical protein M011DRAFT_4382 [Sporormia fimetaria CBS 119925]